MPSAKILESKKAMVQKLVERLNNSQAGVFWPITEVSRSIRIPNSDASFARRMLNIR